MWEGLRLLQEIRYGSPLTWVYADQHGYEPLAQIRGVKEPEILWYHCHPNGTPERLTDEEGNLRWHGHNSAWGKLLREERLSGPNYTDNLRMQGQYLDRETGLHYNLFRYYDPDCGRFTQPDPIGLAGGLNLYQYAPNALGWVDPLGLSSFFVPSIFNAPSGNSHVVYQQSINWDLPVNTRSGIKTNLELVLEGKSPFVVKNGKYSQINLHHSKQNGLGALFELSAGTHQKYYGNKALHPYLPKQHPINPVNRDLFNIDRDSYWRQRGENELRERNLKNKCRG